LSAAAVVVVLVLFLLLRAQAPGEVTKPEHNPGIEDVAAVTKAADAEIPPPPEPTPMTPPAVDTPSLSSKVNQDLLEPVDPELRKIIEAVRKFEDSIKDLRIEYTCLRKRWPELTPEMRDLVDKWHPGWFKPETGVWTQKGDKVRLDWNFYRTSEDQPWQESIAYNGSLTFQSSSEPGQPEPDHGLICAGRWHGIRKWFNPVLTLSATGDKKLSGDLLRPETALEFGDYDINGDSCKLIKLYTTNNKGRIVRSFNVYLDPKRDYTIRKVEKYWDDFLCLEQTVEIKEFIEFEGIELPAKAVCVNYVRPRASDTSYPTCEQQLIATDVKVNQGIDDSAFDIRFKVGTIVSNDMLGQAYTITE